MRAHQEIRMTIPTAGSGPRNLAMTIRQPRGPVAQKKFKSLKEAMMYLKEKDYEDEDDG